MPRNRYDLTWFASEPLIQAAARAEPGLFVVERRVGSEWLPVHIGMSASGIGRTLRWIAQAPTILGLRPDWPAVRVRTAILSGMDSGQRRDRAVLRALRDEVAGTIAAAGVRARLFAPPRPAAHSSGLLAGVRWRHLGALPPYVTSR
jgi:hypothetical protein